MQVRLWSGPIFNLSVTEPAAPKASNLSGRHNFGNTRWPALRRSDFGLDAKALLGPIRPPMPAWLSFLALTEEVTEPQKGDING